VPATFPDAWRRLLRRDLAVWCTYDPAERARLESLILGFLRRTRFEAARGFAVEPAMEVLVAAQACVLLVGLELDEFPDTRIVILHPSTVVQHGRRPAGGRLEATGPLMLGGQAHYRGPVLLSWSQVMRDLRWPTRGQNVVMHEFAHHLDMLDGTVDGTPPLDDPAARQRWIEVCTAAYQTVRSPSEESVLRGYAGVDPGEFFAVATETFFCRPADLREHEPALYRELAAFYGQDPATRQLARTA
jgi:Mlc titration factor MtfA (ptsG expression regulator)